LHTDPRGAQGQWLSANAALHALQNTLLKIKSWVLFGCKVFESVAPTRPASGREEREPFASYACFDRWLYLRRLINQVGENNPVAIADTSRFSSTNFGLLDHINCSVVKSWTNRRRRSVPVTLASRDKHRRETAERHRSTHDMLRACKVTSAVHGAERSSSDTHGERYIRLSSICRTGALSTGLDISTCHHFWLLSDKIAADELRLRRGKRAHRCQQLSEKCLATKVLDRRLGGCHAPPCDTSTPL
jgi:hypothetical protein